ncbi:MAG: hypothetical protein NTY66_03185 [Candidatus Vogelbacteria bacterium]|nr:hypothetical protein [Candidatus Vogelbacteria bacterium]
MSKSQTPNAGVTHPADLVREGSAPGIFLNRVLENFAPKDFRGLGNLSRALPSAAEYVFELRRFLECIAWRAARSGENIRAFQPELLGVPMSSIIIPARTEDFLPFQTFRDQNPKIKFHLVCGINPIGFSDWTLPGREESEGEIVFTPHRLMTDASAIEVFNTFGGPALESSWATLYTQLVRQGHGEDGPLLTDGRRNVFFKRNSREELFSILVHWNKAGWYLQHEYNPEIREGEIVFVPAPSQSSL